jgi:hypothetical protein
MSSPLDVSFPVAGNATATLVFSENIHRLSATLLVDSTRIVMHSGVWAGTAQTLSWSFPVTAGAHSIRWMLAVDSGMWPCTDFVATGQITVVFYPNP